MRTGNLNWVLFIECKSMTIYVDYFDKKFNVYKGFRELRKRQIKNPSQREQKMQMALWGPLPIALLKALPAKVPQRTRRQPLKLLLNNLSHLFSMVSLTVSLLTLFTLGGHSINDQSSATILFSGLMKRYI